ncbi:hypothetical protein C2G38_2044679 [Gigaspora rosea]|uniref:Uncharacterized protein n=1 Tax=Gigaspora rosea TaxID=44941 RepID=A0A397UNQ3_9GLOM|nr:hypothetical protein C2G38_2044679 [Gigaspora rosea]
MAYLPENGVKDGDSFIPGFSCKCEEISGKIYNNPTSAISSLYQRLFETTTKFSGPLIMGPFSFKLDRLNIFVYSIGISDNSCLLSAGSGFNSSFISVIKKNGKAKSPVITQGIEKTGCFINIYVDNQLFKRIEGVDPNQTWKQTGLLKQYEEYHNLWVNFTFDVRSLDHVPSIKLRVAKGPGFGRDNHDRETINYAA